MKREGSVVALSPGNEARSVGYKQKDKGEEDKDWAEIE